MKLLENFYYHVKTSPQAIALVYQDQKINYSDLDAITTKLASTMIEAGFKEKQRAAIYLPKSIHFIICMLATLKAGGTYVPIDYSQPKKRVHYILENCQVSFLFTEQKKSDIYREIIPPTLSTTLLFNVDGDFSFTTENHKTCEKSAPHYQDLAFILYTSGSTGVPKGVKISKQNVQVFIDWCLKEMEITAQDTILNLASFHFDLSVFDIYCTLSQGAKLIISPAWISFNPFLLAKTIQKHQISVLYSVPSLLIQLIKTKAIHQNDLSKLRYILFAGEIFPIKYLREWTKLLPHALFYNLYGPTETNVCTYFKVDHICEQRMEPVPIGKAVTGASLMVLDKEGKPIESGAMGELYVKGPCVTPGYWNYKDKRNSENHKIGLHATGDLVTMEGDNYVFRGRKDDQVKLHGHRIELTEIESVITNHSYVNECVVIVDKEKSQLIAFVVAQKQLSTLVWKEYCSEFLPRYMIPHSFKMMESLPKNINGKIDKMQLKSIREKQLI